MGATGKLSIGMPVACSDGECGDLAGLMVDPKERTVTHLVVDPGQSAGGASAGRLVPFRLVDSLSATGVRLDCTLAQFAKDDPAEVTEVVPGYDPFQTVPYPSGSGFARMGPLAGMVAMGSVGSLYAPPVAKKPGGVIEDNIPDGEGEVARGQHVHATDGPIGHVRGVAVGEGGALSHLLLSEGHLWGTKEVSIPVGAVETVATDGVYLTLSKEEIGQLPPADAGQLEPA